ncbi:zinc finger protein 469 [Synchiropus splendidus]|uniref:zinc finger protein 469 n=1 Tax=Synchiropus splendidus TaxID=270530 RepID=UPI00237E997B|nr:zinc finger protein 469 [Synchiropus splendidus]
MAGETKQLHLGTALHPALQDDGTSLDQQSSPNESSEHFSTTDTDDKVSSKGPKVDKAKRERKGSQREAVIRPQQAGKIDFRSLQNKTKFSADRTWSSGKASPQSPSGKGRNREKGKRCGKPERDNPQPLYNLSITNPRSNLNIGIAYPQQKVSPAKKLETNVPVSGSYRFHVPSVPEREAEMQQEELNHRFQDASSHSLTSQGFTSQSLGSSSGISSHHHLSQQQPATMEGNTGQSGGQVIVPEFQMSGSSVWQSPERTFNGASYGVPSQKCAALKENSKGGTFTPFHYAYNFLEESTSDAFPCEQNTHVDTAGSVHVSHNSYSFMSRDGLNVGQNGTQFSTEHQAEHRSSYHHSSQLQRIQGGAASIQCTRNLSEDSASSDSSGSGSQQLEPGNNSLPENTDTTGCADAEDAAITSGSKRIGQPKDSNAAQRTPLQGGAHRSRNSSGSQINFPNSIHPPSVAFDNNVSKKVLNRHPQSWCASSKTYSPAENRTTHYHDMNESLKFPNQPAVDKRSNSSKSSRLSWQQNAVPTPNRIELSRQINNQKWSYMVSPSDVQDDSKTQKHNQLKIPGPFQKARSAEGFSNQRQETVRHSNATFKIEMSHTQLCESKNKVYFGVNQSVPGAASRTFTYPPLQAPPMGLMMVSPYESPLPSPGHNQASSSTCSSLSPVSTSPVNISADESQMSKANPPNLFFHQPQTKAQLSSETLSSHQFHADPPRSLPTERAKDDSMNYLQNNNASKSTVNKGYVDSFGIEHHQPPPPYSAHQLFANLDQLDVLLTCKQCDQNFSNVTSFLEHKQYCAQHAFAQNDLKDLSKIEDSRKIPAEPAKQPSVSNISASRCSPDLHLSLLGLNKNGELMSESETKGDKDDSMKINLFSGPANAPAALPELELEDAKLDRLITEALNGLGYQSDNAEIDSSFIDAFADDELTTVKGPANKQSLKSKEMQPPESKAKHEADSPITQGKYFYDSDVDSPKTNKDYTESKLEEATLNLERKEKINIKKGVSHKNSAASPEGKTTEQDSKVRGTRKLGRSEDENTSAPRILLSSKFSERCGAKSAEEHSGHATHSHTSPKHAVKESKRKGGAGGTWSKEMIHKIVQQKNKIQKVHVKGSKNLQFSLVMERLTPPVTNPALGEYDYVSNSDDDCEPVKIPSQNRINQSSRCKYTYTKECKWRARNDRDQAAWRHESKECFEVKRCEEVSLSPDKLGANQRLKRRGSRSSTSSDLSASVSVSSDGINSPKSSDPLDSDCEKKSNMKKKNQKTYERSSPQKLLKESGTLALMFTKAVKKCDADKPSLVVSSRDETETAKAVDPPPPALKDTIQKSKSSKSKEKPATGCKETLMSYRDTSERQNKLKEQTQIDSLPQHFDLSTTDKNPDSNVEENTAAGVREKPRAPELQLSFEKQSDSVFVGKEAAALVGELDTHKPVPFCTTLMNETCLSPTDGSLIQKDPLHLMPYPLDQEQGIMKSPLSFDTTSMFGELTPFDTGLYSDMPLPKDNFHSIQNIPEKKEEYVSSLSSFLEQRDWNLIVSPELPVEISQYKENSEKSNEKKADFNHVPLTLPEKIIDYPVNLNSCASEDELEIKRIVNELENQLQSTKLEKQPLLCESDPKQMQMSKFSPLCLDEESQSDGSDLSSSVTTLPSEPFTEPGMSWSSPFQFELMTDTSSPHSTVHEDSLEHLTKKESALTSPHPENDASPLLSDYKDLNPQNDNPTESKENVFDQQQYAENLMKSLEVISDSVFSKDDPQETKCQKSTETDHATEAVTQNDNKLSSSNINEEEGSVGFILNGSQLSPPDASKHSVDAKQLKCGTEEEMKVVSDSEVVKPLTALHEETVRNKDLTEHGMLLESGHQPEQSTPNQEGGTEISVWSSQGPPSPAPHPDVETEISTDLNHNHQGRRSPHADLLIFVSSNKTIEPTNQFIELATEIYAPPSSDLSMEIVTTDKPCSPLLVDTSHDSCSTYQEFRSSDEQSGQAKTSEDISCPVYPITLKNELSLSFGTIEKQDDLLNVSVHKDLPVDFMEGHQDSQCQEDGLFQPKSPSMRMFPTEVTQELEKEDHTGDVRSAAQEHKGSNSDSEYDGKLMNPPVLDLGITQCQIPSSRTSTPPPQAATVDASGPTIQNHDFDLSSLNYSDEPPQLHQYDLLPISPAKQSKDNPDVQHSPKHNEESVNSAAIFNTKACDPTVDPDPAAGIHSSVKCPEIRENINMAFGFSDDIKSSETSNGVPPMDLELCDDQVQPNALLRKDTLLPIIGENKELPPPHAAGSLPTTEARQSSTTQRRTQSINQDGNVLCEICSMCFRTVPGLKRHKAMKHLVKSEKRTDQANTTVRLQDTTVKTSVAVEKLPEAESQISLGETAASERSASASAKMSDTKSVLLETATETMAVDLDKINSPKDVMPTKEKASKRRAKELKFNPYTFTDDVLNRLKTDILQAITPDFKLNGHQEPGKPTDDLLEINNTPVTLSTELTGEDSKSDKEKIQDVHEAVERIDTPLFEECTRMSDLAIEEVPLEEVLNAEESCDLKEISEVDIKCERGCEVSEELCPPSCLSPPRLCPPSTDIKAIFDDDTTFSQLFPRDEETKRKKCPRVYSKKNKRQKVSHDSNATLDFLPPSENVPQNQADNTFPENQTCEYKTISIVDTILLNMCHSGLKPDAELVPDVPLGDKDDFHDGADELGNPSLHPLQSTIDKSLIEWSDISVFDSSSGVTQDPLTCKAEVPTSPLLMHASPFPTEPCITGPGPNFQSIDIQNINTTFQLPDIQFFDASKELAAATPGVDMETQSDDSSRKLAERRGRKKQEGGMKVKDKQYKCKVCFMWFLTLGELNFHKLSHNPSPPPTCYMCVQRKFSSREQLRDHLREKHAKNKTGIWTCGMCLKEISDVWMYNEHLREHATQFARRGQAPFPGCFMQETAVKNFITSIMQHRSSKASKESGKATREQDKSGASEGSREDGKSSNALEPKLQRPKSSTAGGRQNSLTPLEVLHKAETPKSVEMHPNCKDPSRDCHHCGKQFPKPFKLQRHLVTHNLEKIFLCHKCPVSYQESQDLKEHLKRVHGEVDELDSKHTTLYTCELCADVMHVIKKSFICSTCNYTFSKKEQFDRHMEKHLSGGNTIFKFRGVLRPIRGSREEHCFPPANKKRRIRTDSLQESSSDSGIASEHSETSKMSVSMSDDSTQTIANEYPSDTNVKTEDEDFSELLVELKQSVHVSSPELAAPKTEEADLAPSSFDLEDDGISLVETCDVKEEAELVDIRVESWPSNSSLIGEGNCKEESAHSPQAGEDSHVVSKMQEEDDLQQSDGATVDETEQEVGGPGAEESHENQLKQVRTAESVRHSKPSDTSPVLLSKVSPNSSLNEDSVRQQKKRKEMKSTHSQQRLASPTTQENYDWKSKKKNRAIKSSNTPQQRKSDEYPVLSSVRDDVVGNKILPKTKPSSPFKRNLQTMATPLNGDYKSKKGTPGRPLHTSISKAASVPMNNSLNKSRPRLGVNHSYRTAESQNNLLSQLFGQKLTSFKIPLRKDTSESMN